MKVIIAGSRTLRSISLIEKAVKASGFQITEVVSGAAKGIDELGEKWAQDNGIPFKRFRADWTFHGKAAGPIRNKKMAEYAEGLIAIWDGRSPGTRNMIEEAKKNPLKIYIYRTDKPKTDSLIPSTGF